MASLIDKNIVAAEIEKCYNECIKRAKVTDPDYWNGKADAYRNALTVLNGAPDWRPSKKQIESLRDLLKYNIGVFETRKFMEVNSLYEDLLNSKL